MSCILRSRHPKARRRVRPAWPWALLLLSLVLHAAGARAEIRFEEVADQVGLDFASGVAEQAFPQFTGGAATLQVIMGTGAAVADYDADGDLDVYLLGHLGQPNKLYENRLESGTLSFQDVTPPVLAETGLSRVAHFVDLDRDGDLDLVLVNDHDDLVPPVSEARLFRNEGGTVWTDVTEGSGFAPVGYLRAGASIVDYDGDGRLDIYVTNWGASSPGFPTFYPGSNRLYRNLGGFVFQDVTESVGLGVLATNSYTAVFADFDDDSDPDLHVAVDFFSDVFYRNDGGVFTDVTTQVGATHTGNDMGVACADVDDDGDLDLYATNITDPLDAFGFPSQGNVYYENQLAQTGVLSFIDRAHALGIDDTYWGWGTELVDLENDGDLDLVAVNGFDEQTLALAPGSLPLYQTPSVLFENDGAGSFVRRAGTGIELPDDSRGLVAFDADRDGDVDLLVTNHAQPVRFFRNTGSGHGHWLTVRLAPDAAAISASVRVRTGAQVQRRDVIAGRSYLAGTPAEVHFGLGATTLVDEVRVRWRDGSETVLTDVAADRVLDVVGAAPLLDGDGDGLIDADESAVGTDPDDADSDDDGIPDGIEVGSVQAPGDLDGDGTIDALDPDDDGDGVPTRQEDTNGNGDPTDDDADGDGVPDYLETDADADGVDDATDNCPAQANPPQADVNGDGFGDACQPDDADGDGWPNDADNCPVVENADQADGDGDGTGDACTDTRVAARQWNEELLEAIRRDLARPTVHARNLFHVSAAMWDAWAAYDAQATQILHMERASAPDPATARAKAISFAAYRVLRARFESSPSAAFSLLSFASRMRQLGYDPEFTATSGDVDPAAELGNRIAASVLAYGLLDGSNEQDGYANQYYEPANPPLIMALPGNPDVLDLNRWQPLALSFFIDQSGNPIPGGSPPFLSPEWGQVAAFALDPADATVQQRGGFAYRVHHDPGPPFLLGEDTAEDFLDGFEMVALWSSQLDPGDGVLWDVSPGGQGRSPLPEPDEWRSYYDFEGGGDWGTGYDTNPVTGEPYPPQIVPRADYARVLAEFWADGPDSETPPGHWFTIANYVNDNLTEKRLGGTGPAMDEQEWHVKLYLALGGALHDVAVAVWGAKGWYDYVRPVSVLRAMGERGQRSDPGLPSYHPEGFALRPGFIELVTAESSAAGERHAHLAASVGEVAIRAWRGPDAISAPETDVAGVGWILARAWWPYQRPSFVTPPFAGYPSGHSAFSRAAATVLHQLTGSQYFPGGLGEFQAPAGAFLVFEDGPSVDFALQYASYYDASDQTSLSRIWGGIHPPQDDLVSRHMGARIAVDGVAHALTAFHGAPVPDGDADGVPDVLDNCPLRENPHQSDLDDDRTGDRCDDRCAGADVTRALSLGADAVPAGATASVAGSGFGPDAYATIGGVKAQTVLWEPDRLMAQVPVQVGEGIHPVVVVDPEGCRSQEELLLTVLPPPPGACGLLGVEPLAVLLLVRRRHRRRAHPS